MVGTPSISITSVSGNSIDVHITNDLAYDYFILEYSKDLSLWEQYYTTSTNVTIPYLDYNTGYYFRAYQIYLEETSEASNTEFAITEGGGTLQAPSLSINRTGSLTADINITGVENGDTYQLERSTTNDFATATIIYTGVAGTYSDTAPSAGVYYYRAKSLATGSYGDSDYSDTVSIDLSASGTALNAPLLSDVVIGDTSVSLKLNTVLNGSNYVIERATDSGFTTKTVVYTGVAPYTLNEFGLTKNTSYYYRAKALGYGSYYESPWSATITATTLNTLSVPLLSLVSKTETGITLSIGSVTNGANYQLERSEAFDSGFTAIYTGGIGNYTDSGLTPNTNYYYRVKALANGSYLDSAYSPVLTTSTSSPIANYGLKYEMNFEDEAGKDFSVKLYRKGYVGNVIDLTGTENPLSISQDVKIDDFPKEPIADLKITINVRNPYISGIYEDLDVLDDTTAWVEVLDVDANYKFTGWLVSDERHFTFDKTLAEISLTVVSPLSIAKSKMLLDGDGKMLYDKYTPSEIINYILELIAPVASSYVVKTGLKEDAYTGSDDFFKQFKLKVEGFNDSDGRPPKCYDVLKSLASSHGFRLSWANNTLIFDDPYYLASQSTNIDVKIKRYGVSTNNFFTGNSEDLSRSRSVNEISGKYDYKQNVGLLKNGNFWNYNDGLFEDWVYENTLKEDNSIAKYYNKNEVIRFGTGRQLNPYRARIKGDIGFYMPFFSTPTNSQSAYINYSENKIKQAFYSKVNVYKNEKYRIRIDYRYFDWMLKYVKTEADKKAPAFHFIISVQPSAGASYDNSYYFFDAKDLTYAPIEGAPNKFFEFHDADIGKKWVSGNERGTIWKKGLFASYIAVDSVNITQKYEADLPPIPIDGELVIMLVGFNKVATPISGSDLYIDIENVIISKTPVIKGTKQTGETHYLTSNEGSKNEAIEATIGHYKNEGIAGNILKLDGNNSTGYNGNILQKDILKRFLSLKRSPRYTLDSEVHSNELRFTDVVAIKEGASDLLPDKYIVSKIDYDVKACQMRTSFFQLKKEDKTAFESEPSNTNDMYEYYPIQSTENA